MEVFQKYFVDIIQYKYADFKGRARRSEYWYFALFNVVLTVLLYALVFFGAAMESRIISGVGGLLVGLFTFGTIVPRLAVLARRLHDTGRSGWFFLIGLIPLVGGIILLVWLFTEGESRENNWGPNPKEVYVDDMNSKSYI